MEITKALWSNDDDSFKLSMSISKIDAKRRLVEGWGTIDNPDLHDDVVTAEASRAAFAKFKGNLREMHQPIAAGRMVSYRPQQYVDPDTGNVYNGIYVQAYVSEGAESTWKKVVDGTLSAFSINGKVTEAHSEYHPELQKTLRYVTGYSLNELSLVDAGGNQFSNIVSIVKDVEGGGYKVTGELAGVETANVFFCNDDRIVELSSDESLVCQKGHDMSNIGWVETNTAHTMEKVNTLIAEHVDYLKKSNEGGVDNMADEAATTEETAPVVEETKTEEAAPVEEAVVVEEAPVEEAAADEAKEEEAGEEKKADAADALDEALEKAIDGLRSGITEHFDQIMKDVDGKMSEFRDEFDKRFAELEEKQGEISKALDSVKGDLTSMTKDVNGLQDESATKKSGDLGGEPEGDISKSADAKPGIWHGSIL